MGRRAVAAIMSCLAYLGVSLLDLYNCHQGSREGRLVGSGSGRLMLDEKIHILSDD